MVAMGTSGGFRVRRMSRAEVGLAIDWAAGEGWNPGLHDADCFYETDPEGFLVGLLDEDPVGCISAVAYNDDFGFVGFYIVKPEHRGKGYGGQLWRAAMEHLGGRNVGLDGVADQGENYLKAGFHFAHRNIRYRGYASISEVPPNVIELPGQPSDALKAYDNALFPAPRSRFLEHWINLPESSALAVMEDDEFCGYGVIRACRDGFKVGPLFADDPIIAECLFRSLSSYAGWGSPVFLDVPEVNGSAVELAEMHGMEKVFETARMYTREEPKLSLDRVYGVTSVELG